MCNYIQTRLKINEKVNLRHLTAQVPERRISTSQVHNAFTYQPALCIVPKSSEDDIQLVEMEWGFLPGYITTRESAGKMRRGYKNEKGVFVPPLTMVNAKGEELLQPRKVFRNAALNRRCLVLATGFFEWRHVYRTNKRTGEPLKTPDKFPYHITVKGQPYFYMAGIYQPFTDRETGETFDTMAIVTTAANPLMKVIHNAKERMPVILDDNHAYEWILSDLNEDQITEIANYQYPWQQMNACTVPPKFQELDEPTTPHEYSDLPAFELAIQ